MRFVIPIAPDRLLYLMFVMLQINRTYLGCQNSRAKILEGRTYESSFTEIIGKGNARARSDSIFQRAINSTPEIAEDNKSVSEAKLKPQFGRCEKYRYGNNGSTVN
jgi:hypothetical protein